MSTRKTNNAEERGPGQRLPLRWAVILMGAGLIGVVVGVWAGPAFGVGSGIALAGFLHAAID